MRFAMMHMHSALLISAFVSACLLCSAIAAIDFEKCTFETDNCQWKMVAGKLSVSWKSQLSSSLEYSDRNIPSHLTQGNVLVGNATRDDVSDGIVGTADLLSEELRPSDGVCGIQLSYYKPDEAGNLTVYLQLMNKQLMKLQTLNSGIRRNGYWSRQYVPFDVIGRVRLVLKLEVSSSTLRPVAVDNIQFLSCSVCTFESGYCGWTNVQGKRYIQWTNHSRTTKTGSTGPSYDHTYGIDGTSGYYLYIQKPDQSTEIETAVLTRNLTVFDHVCSLSFAYHMYGNDGEVGSLMVSVNASNKVTVLWNMSGNLGDKWLTAVVPLGKYISSKTSQLAIVAKTVANGRQGDIAIDDVELRLCAVTDLCTFAQDSCNWRNDDNSFVQWKIQQNNNATSHTNVMVANFSSISIPNNGYAALRGPSVFPGDFICSLRLHYTTSGLNNSELCLQSMNLTGEYDIVTDLPISLTTTSWIMEYHLPPWPAFPVIYAERIDGENGSIVLHSLEFISCRYTTFEVEKQFILWRKSTFSKFNGRWFLLTTGLRHLQNVQPLDDHTYRQYRQHGHYRGHYIMQAQMKSQNSAVLITSVKQNNICGIRFWLYRNIGARYKIDVSAIYRGGLPTQLHASRASDHDLEIWHSKEGATQMDIFGAKIMLQLTSWNSSKGRVAIDDIEFTECAVCSLPRGYVPLRPDYVVGKSLQMHLVQQHGLDGEDHLTKHHLI
ncbi:MAM and LDL-receptor class A domain-containing protein 1-like [Corticium candelabrum]|uniref:MAM and LDL-receptor class A domain-containing protein 1-like n=1 Tax=Corticium candelabrum TaxID=121492 RepID=UPI002E25F3CB|nr:MAM and LDL-receptor class A domain-containing protein 1-like [Corticium candelabrum]